MTFEEAIIKSIKVYRSGKDPEELFKVVGGVKYTRDYFDELEKELVGEEVVEKETKRGKRNA